MQSRVNDDDYIDEDDDDNDYSNRNKMAIITVNSSRWVVQGYL